MFVKRTDYKTCNQFLAVKKHSHLLCQFIPRITVICLIAHFDTILFSLYFFILPSRPERFFKQLKNMLQTSYNFRQCNVKRPIYTRQIDLFTRNRLLVSDFLMVLFFNTAFTDFINNNDMYGGQINRSICYVLRHFDIHHLSTHPLIIGKIAKYNCHFPATNTITSSKTASKIKVTAITVHNAIVEPNGFINIITASKMFKSALSAANPPPKFHTNR